MDLFETIFKKIAQSNFVKKKDPLETLYHKDIPTYFDVFANSLALQSKELKSVASRDYVGIQGSQLYLPEKIKFFASKEKNKKLFQHLILQIMGAHHLSLHRSPFHNDNQMVFGVQGRLRFLTNIGSVNCLLDSMFPGFAEFQRELVSDVESMAILKGEKSSSVFKAWSGAVLSRGAHTDVPVMRSLRRNEIVPEFLFVTVPCLEITNLELRDMQPPIGGTSSENRKIETEKEKTYSSVVKSVDIEKEMANPVLHSFEKLETADEYEGGRRIDSGDDELDSHAQALDELNLSKITRGGEAALSSYKSDTFMDIDINNSQLNGTTSANSFLYPEWNYRKSRYLENHCQLIETAVTDTAGGLVYKDKITREYQFRIRQWQSQIESILTQPLWLRRLKDGDEIDIDEVIRDFGDLLRKKNVESRWFMSRRRLVNDIEIVIMFDQSYSSDSWMNNRRVLDVTLESLVLLGVLFDKIFDKITVAGVSSASRHQCRFQIYKEPNEDWRAFFRRAESIQAQGYTRLGPAIRHATNRLKKSTKSKKLILLLTDGKPTDIDGYEGVTGIEDVSQACREADAAGILHYAIVLDHKQKLHFSKMFDHHVLLHQPQDMPRELIKVLMQLVN